MGEGRHSQESKGEDGTCTVFLGIVCSRGFCEVLFIENAAALYVDRSHKGHPTFAS